MLIRDAEALEQMEKIDTIIVDKTGTLTEGRPAVTATIPADGFTEGEALRLAASVERASEHPLALAILRAAEGRGLTLTPVADFDSPTGKGAMGMVEGRRIALGNASFLAEQGIDVAPLADQADQLREDGATAIFMGVDGQPAAIFAIADPIKPETPAALAALKGDLTGTLRARRLSQAVMRNIRENLFFVFIYNALGVPVAAGVLYPFLGLLLSPIIAAAAMTLSSVSVILNAARLRGVKL